MASLGCLELQSMFEVARLPATVELEPADQCDGQAQGLTAAFLWIVDVAMPERVTTLPEHPDAQEPPEPGIADDLREEVLDLAGLALLGQEMVLIVNHALVTGNAVERRLETLIERRIRIYVLTLAKPTQRGREMAPLDGAQVWGNLSRRLNFLDESAVRNHRLEYVQAPFPHFSRVISPPVGGGAAQDVEGVLV